MSLVLLIKVLLIKKACTDTLSISYALLNKFLLLQSAGIMFRKLVSIAITLQRMKTRPWTNVRHSASTTSSAKHLNMVLTMAVKEIVATQEHVDFRTVLMIVDVMVGTGISICTNEELAIINTCWKGRD